MADIMAEPVAESLPLLPSESSFLSGTATDASRSNTASSLGSTPPTSVSPDNISLASDQDTAKPPIESALLIGEQEARVLSLHHEGKHVELELESKQSEQSEQPRQQTEEAAQPDLQLRRESETAQVTPEPESEMDAGQQTPAASAIVVAPEPEPTSEPSTSEPSPAATARPRRARASLPVYNLSKLLGTDIHGRRGAKGDDVGAKSRRRVSAGDALINNAAAAGSSTENMAEELVGDAINALDLDWSVAAPATPQGAKIAKKNKSEPKKDIKPEPVTRRATRLSGAPAPNAVTAALTSIGRRGKKSVAERLSRISRELKQLQDTKEFAHVDDRPVIETVWSNGKFVDPRTLNKPAAESRASKRVKTNHNTETEATAEKEPAAEAAVSLEVQPQKKRIAKKWLEKGLYAGQETPKDLSLGLTTSEKKRLAQYPELSTVWKANKTLPPPMFNGLRLLIQGRDFKLPYDICNPLPPGQPKPAAYRTMTKNRFVGDAAAYWKKQPHLEDFQSRCVCKPEDGCGEDCQNRIMLYECDDTNCNLGKDHCTNRAFQTLQERTKQGGRYRIGVEVFKTEGKGYGVRSNRCFRPHQIIMEYTGEIITEEECERRMKEVYKDNECYYLMSFDQNMIIDATTGSIARFVNHSCSPNCRMIKWIVGGQPRMALFAGDRPIMTGEELTYDYNFDPFSAKNVQKCLCGADNCRGILGPRPRENKVPKSATAPSKDEAGKKAVGKAVKRKLKELEEDVYDDVEGASTKSIKKRKIAVATGAASHLSKSGLKVAKGAATALKRSVSTISGSAKAALSAKTQRSSPLRRTSTGGMVKSYAKNGSPGKGKASAKDTAKITTTKAAMAALTSLGLPVKPPTIAAKKASRSSSSASLTIVAAPARGPAKALAATDGNAKKKPKISKPKVKTPNKRSPPKRAQRLVYTPTGSPKSASAKREAVKLSARKKTPSRKILESKVAGTASVTKPKAKPKARSRSKAVEERLKGGLMAAIMKAVKSATAPPPAGQETTEPKEDSPVTEGSTKSTIEAAPLSVPSSPSMSPMEEQEPRKGLDVPRAEPLIRLVEPALDG